MRLRPGFFLREALTNIRLNPLMSLTAATTTFVCLLVLGVGLLVGAHVEGVIGSVREDVGVEAFFPEDATLEEMEEARRSVEGYPEVERVELVSEQEALADFKKTYEARPDVYEGLESGVLPASLRLRLEDPRSADAVARKLEAEGFAEEIDYPRQTIGRINEVTGYMVWGLRGATALFLLSSVLLISNAIRLSIFARRKEIEVMKLVGASDGFVRAPFLLEGLAQGLLGAIFAALIVIWANTLFLGWSRDVLPFVPISADAVNAPLVLLVLVAVGATIGLVGSFLSVARFLRV